MSLSSPEFIVFFCITALLYFSFPHRFRWVVLLVFSYLFYAFWSLGAVPILLISSLVNYALGKRIYSAETSQRKSFYLTTAIVINLGILFIFKYFNFFGASLTNLLNMAHISFTYQALNIVLPIGISFYTFQQISYCIDVHQARLKPEPNFGIYALFVAFFPHIISGPIDRGTGLLPQLHKQIDFDSARTSEGLRLILWGVFKKTIIADRLAAYVDVVYQNPYQYSGPFFIVATLFFAFQIYADFSAYTNIAIGVAKILGFDLTVNFQQPYLATSVREFWQRWHMSLSSWIRDYLFSPLARKTIRVTKGKYPRVTQLIVSVVVMGLVGLWHGANWTFVIWGVLQGLFLGLEAFLRNLRLGRNTDASSHRTKGFRTVLSTLTTFLLISLSWVFFRANNINDALHMLTHLFSWDSASLVNLSGPLSDKGLVLCFFLIIVLIAIDLFNSRANGSILLDRIPSPLRLAIYYLVIFIILEFGVVNTPQFIYARF